MTPDINPALGVPPTLEWVAVGAIGVDPAYQRTVENAGSATLIRKITRFWDWGLCQPLACTRRDDGSIWAVDGQHRLAAAKARGDIPHLPCVIVRHGGLADEAAAFVALNRQRKPLTALDLFRAALAAGDPEALLVLNLIEAAGLSMVTRGNDITKWKPGQITCAPTVIRLMQRRGRNVAAAALGCLAEAFAGQVLRYAAVLLDALGDALTGVGGGHVAPIDRDRFVAVLATRSQSDWIAAGSKIQHEAKVSRAQGLAQAMLEAYGAAAARREPTNGPPPPASTVTPRPAASAAVAARRAPVRVLPERVDLPADSKRWCDQCERRVSLNAAALCASTFCRLRPKMAALA